MLSQDDREGNGPGRCAGDAGHAEALPMEGEHPCQTGPDDDPARRPAEFPRLRSLAGVPDHGDGIAALMVEQEDGERRGLVGDDERCLGVVGRLPASPDFQRILPGEGISRAIHRGRTFAFTSGRS